MRTIIISEDSLREAISAGVEIAQQASEYKKEIMEALDNSMETLCENMRDEISRGLKEKIENISCDINPDTDKIFDTILDQAQRVGTVTDLM